MCDFLEIFFFFPQKVIYLKEIFVYPFKKFNSVKKNSLGKNNHSLKQTHSVKHEFYF